MGCTSSRRAREEARAEALEAQEHAVASRVVERLRDTLAGELAAQVSDHLRHRLTEELHQRITETLQGQLKKPLAESTNTVAPKKRRAKTKSTLTFV